MIPIKRELQDRYPTFLRLYIYAEGLDVLRSWVPLHMFFKDLFSNKDNNKKWSVKVLPRAEMYYGYIINHDMSGLNKVNGSFRKYLGKNKTQHRAFVQLFELYSLYLLQDALVIEHIPNMGYGVVFKGELPVEWEIGDVMFQTLSGDLFDTTVYNVNEDTADHYNSIFGVSVGKYVDFYFLCGPIRFVNYAVNSPLEFIRGGYRIDIKLDKMDLDIFKGTQLLVDYSPGDEEDKFDKEVWLLNRPYKVHKN